jgi:lipoprotein-releasing system permease protein
VIGAAPYVNAQALLTRGESVRGVLIRGVDPAAEPEVSDIDKQVRGAALTALADGEFGIVLGGELARALGVALGEKVTLIAPQGQITPAGVVPRLKQFTVLAVFDSGHFEYDSALALIHIGDAQRLFRVDGPTGVRLKIKDMQRAQDVGDELARSLPPGMIVRDWTRQNRTWFAAVQVEKRMMFIILALIVAVAAFNLVSTLVMTVTEKQSDIAILRTLGASPSSIMAVFMVQGALIGVLGTLLGVASGLFVANHLDTIFPAIERIAGFPLIPKDIYFISSLPSDPRASDIVPIAVISIVLSLVATLYPSWRASRVKPAEALRYD